MTTEEQVLCLCRDSLPPDWCRAPNNAIPMAWDDFITATKHSQALFLNRRQAEQELRCKQLIPYILLRDLNSNVAAYPRHGSEIRLHGLWSAAIGGHVNAHDHQTELWQESISMGMQREMQEELPGLQGQPQFLGLINEEESAVGRVHLGLVFLLNCPQHPDNISAELQGLCWLNQPEIAARTFELWSQLALSLLPKG
ncbi:MAG: hypothetical protein GX564_13030 [Oligosphaeraceae bacterium]|nr:hypothetical protein [Oligosphaeraceae bacterium]